MKSYILARCRKFVGYFKHSALATDLLMKTQADLHVRTLKPVQDVTTRWINAYYMLHRLLYLKRPLDVVLATDEKAKGLMLSQQEWNVMEDVVEVLQLHGCFNAAIWQYVGQ